MLSCVYSDQIDCLYSKQCFVHLKMKSNIVTLEQNYSIKGEIGGEAQCYCVNLHMTLTHRGKSWHTLTPHYKLHFHSNISDIFMCGAANRLASFLNS